MSRARNPRAEATRLAGAEVRVLEPSPPAVNEPPWFADDPAAVDEPGATVVTPTSAGQRTWDELAATDPEIARYAREHWLGAYKPLPPVPAGYVPSREDFHRVAYAVVSNARKQANGKFGLRYTRGGFGTPFFGDDEQVRVEGANLVVQRGDAAVTEPLTTLARAAEVAGTVADDAQAESDTVPLGDIDRPLDVRADVGAFLGDWFGFATGVLEELRLTGTAPDDDVSRVQIWPGHFDPAVELGSSDAGRRASYGASPGDGGSDEPYLYVGPWSDSDRSDPYWNAEGFGGASLSYRELLEAGDPRRAALDFFRHGYDLLHRN